MQFRRSPVVVNFEKMCINNSGGSFCIGDILCIWSVSISISLSCIVANAPIVEEESLLSAIIKSSSWGPGDESELSDSTVLVLTFLRWVWIGGNLERIWLAMVLVCQDDRGNWKARALWSNSFAKQIDVIVSCFKMDPDVYCCQVYTYWMRQLSMLIELKALSKRLRLY